MMILNLQVRVSPLWKKVTASQFNVYKHIFDEASVVISSVVRYPRYLDTYRRYLCDDTSIANVTIYRGIS